MIKSRYDAIVIQFLHHKVKLWQNGHIITPSFDKSFIYYDETHSKNQNTCLCAICATSRQIYFPKYTVPNTIFTRRRTKNDRIFTHTHTSVFVYTLAHDRRWKFNIRLKRSCAEGSAIFIFHSLPWMAMKISFFHIFLMKWYENRPEMRFYFNYFWFRMVFGAFWLDYWRILSRKNPCPGVWCVSDKEKRTL